MKMQVLTRLTTIAAAGTVLAGCAASPNPDPRDPWEGFNRGVYKFNNTVDRVLFKPIAQGYTYVVPSPAHTCVHNMFSNLGDLWAGTNSMLQGRGHDFINTLGRFLFNTTLGVGGCIDVASKNGARKIPNDFSTTLGVWGFSQGPYLVLPLWGASTVRDGVGLIGDWNGNQLATVGRIDNIPLRNSLWGLGVIDARAHLLDVTNTIDRVALDPYSFIRDAYLQRRAAMVRGNLVGDDSELPNYENEEGDAPFTAVPAATQPAK